MDKKLSVKLCNVIFARRIFISFGAKVISDQTGIILNNEMDDFTSPGFASDSNVPPNNRANLIRPGKRPVSSMVPSIIVRSDAGTVRLIVGGTGGTQITTSVSSVYVSLIPSIYIT